MKQAIDLDPGLTIDAYFFDDQNRVWNGSGWEAFSNANILEYAINAAETTVNVSGRYSVLVPFATPGDYSVNFRRRVGASPAFDDVREGTNSFSISTSSTVPTANTGNSTATYQYQITLIDNKINAILANPRPNYQVGQTKMDMASLLETLMKTRDRILFLMNSLQSESFETLNTDVNEFGQDIADYINEENE